jgi:hypothetical protein
MLIAPPSTSLLSLCCSHVFVVILGLDGREEKRREEKRREEKRREEEMREGLSGLVGTHIRG